VEAAPGKAAAWWNWRTHSWGGAARGPAGRNDPYYYFDYLRTKHAFRLVPIFHHNALDILSLACLHRGGAVRFRSPEEAALRHGADFIGLARWVLQAGRQEEALRLFPARGGRMGLPDDLLFRTLWDTAALERRLGREHARRGPLYTDLAVSRNPYRVRAMEEMAKYYEHRERNYAMALEFTRGALALERHARNTAAQERLKARVDRPAPRRLL